MRYVDGLASTLAGAAVPYGYSVVVWTSGAFLLLYQSTPHVWEVVLYAAGAASAYGVLRVAAANGEVDGPQGIGKHGVFRGGAIHLVSMAAAIAAAGGLAQLGTIAAWALAPGAATLIYLGGTALNEAREVVLADRER